MATASTGNLLTRHPFVTAALAGVIAGAVTAGSDRALDKLVSKKQKERDKAVREAPAHQLAGPHFAARISGRELNDEEKKRARMVFGMIYGVGWGLIYGALRRKLPLLGRWRGLPFSIPFFFACDGTIAPLIGISPTLRRIPWQMNAKEMANHITWTAVADAVHRAVAKGKRG